jgi:hypothetical protein
MLRKYHSDVAQFVGPEEEIAAARRFDAKDEDIGAN